MAIPTKLNTKINLDVGVIKNLDVNNFKNILVLTGSKNSLKIFKESIAPLIKTKFYLYSGITTNPNEQIIYNITNYARDKNIDAIISVGGGSVMDSGRMISLLLSHSGFLHDYAIGGTIGSLGISPKLIYHITVPTISGTGAEISSKATFMHNNTSQIISSPYLIPNETYIDPGLMIDIPKKLWATIAFDCFTNSLEAYVSIYATPTSDIFAEDALKTCIKHIPTILKDNNNINVIKKIVVASINSLIASNMASVGAIHAIAGPISAKFNIYHGTALAMACAPVCEMNYEFNKPKFNKVKKLFGRSDAKIKTVINSFIDGLNINIPSIKSKLTAEVVREIANESMNADMRGNPKLMTYEDIKKIIENIKYYVYLRD